MKHVITIAALLFASFAFGETSTFTPQQQQQMEKYAQRVCQAPWAGENDPERLKQAEAVARLRPILARQYPNERIAYITIQSNVVNAFTYTIGDHLSVVCMPTAIIDMMGSVGEIAFILGHETGHAIDEACKAAKAQKNSLQLTRQCELRADRVGFSLLVAAGYSPYDAGGSFGKFEMYNGDTKTGIGAKLAALSNDHPMTPQRIDQMRQMLIQYGKSR
jgi:predicted Zn-dependent protease